LVPPRDFGLLSWPNLHLAWDLVDLTGNGLFEILTLHGDGRVTAQGVSALGVFQEPRLLVESRSYLPRGVTRMRFARDVNGDGLADFVLPAAGIFRIYIQDDSGSFGEPMEIEYEARVEHEVGDPSQLDSVFGQEISIPFFTLEDVDGDERIDLVSKTRDRVDFHLASPDISATPTWSLNLLELESSLPKRDGVNLDDLMSNIDGGVRWSLENVDGVAPRDLVVQLGGTLRIYRGGSVTGLSRAPDQVLKVSGNLLMHFLRDAQGDDLPDLQLLRGERISLGRVLRWLILPGSLDFEFFTYVNEEGTFSRKPTRRNTISLKVPRLLSLMDDVEGIDELVVEQMAIPAKRADLDGDGAASDVVDIVDGEILYFPGIAPEEDLALRSLQRGELGELLDRFILDDVNRLEDGESQVIDLGNMMDWNFSPALALRKACQGEKPSLVVKGGFDGIQPALRVLDLDGDGRDDVVAWVTIGDESNLLKLLVQAAR
jgi:hypothetical protein